MSTAAHSSTLPKAGGVVHLVGAGPGDPELLTLRALRLIESADAIVYDRLVGQGVLDLIPVGVTRFYVGKTSGHHPVPQDRIEALLIQLARAGHCIVRLKGGDPFVFGRGGEEAESLRAAGIQVEIVPGISAAFGCAAAAGLPLTFRGVARSLHLVTAHAQADEDLDLDWSTLAGEGTVVAYMGVGTAERLARELIAAGRGRTTPVAVIERGTTPDMRVFRTTLCMLPATVDAAGIEPPALIVVGEVVERMPEQPALVQSVAAGA